MLRELKSLSVGVIVGLIIAAPIILWNRQSHRVAVDIAPMPAVVHADKSVTLQKEAASKPEVRMTTPKGAKIVRQESVVIQPKDANCASVVAWLDITEDSEGVTRVTASSPSGTVVSGKDVIIWPKHSGKWLAGAGVDRGFPSIAVGRSFGDVTIIGSISGNNTKTLSGSVWALWSF